MWIGNTEPTFIEDSKRNYTHRTVVNARWSDITLAFAVDMDSPGEITTKEAAGERYAGYRLPDEYGSVCSDSEKMIADEIVSLVKAHSHCHKGGLKLNIAGNSQITLDRYGITTEQIRSLIRIVLKSLMQDGVSFSEIRSGGQTGVDEAGIKAAQDCGIKCSILAPKGFRMHYEAGVELEGRDRFVERFMCVQK